MIRQNSPVARGDILHAYLDADDDYRSKILSDRVVLDFLDTYPEDGLVCIIRSTMSSILQASAPRLKASLSIGEDHQRSVVLRGTSRSLAYLMARMADLTSGDENAPPFRANGSVSTSWQDNGGRLPVRANRIRAESLVGANRPPHGPVCCDRVRSRVAVATIIDGR